MTENKQETPVAQPEPIVEEELFVEDKTLPEVIQEIEDVGDWEVRFRKAKYTDYQKSVIKMAHEKQAEYERILKESKWINQVTDTKADVVIEYITSIRGNNTLKASGSFPYPIDYVFRTICGKYREKYDINVDENRILTKVCANTYTLYQKSKKMFVVAPRDFVLYNHVDRVSVKFLTLLET